MRAAYLALHRRGAAHSYEVWRDGELRGGLYGVPPVLAQLDGNGNLPVGVDFRQMYATVLGPWWGLDSANILRQRFDPLPLLRA